MIDLRSARFLASAEGLRTLEEDAALADPSPREIETLRARAGDHVGAVVEEIELRRRARVKFARAERMLFTRDGLEQASAEPLAAHRARRFARIPLVADLGCGIGGDLVALAREAAVVGVDLDPVRLGFARHNLAVHGLEGRAGLVCADVRTWVPEAPVYFLDPSRRTERRKGILTLEGVSPPFSFVRTLFARAPDLCVKTSPLVRREAVGDLEPEFEYVSFRGECREAVLWTGGLRTAPGRATILPDGETIAGEPGRMQPPLGEAGAWLHDPDPALVVSGLLGAFAEAHALRVLDPRIAYLTGDHPLASPFVRSYRILERFPFQLKRLRARLAAHEAGSVEIKKRGFPVSPEELRRKLRLRGTRARTVFLARLGERHEVFLAEPAP